MVSCGQGRRRGGVVEGHGIGGGGCWRISVVIAQTTSHTHVIPYPVVTDSIWQTPIAYSITFTVPYLGLQYIPTTSVSFCVTSPPSPPLCPSPSLPHPPRRVAVPRVRQSVPNLSPAMAVLPTSPTWRTTIRATRLVYGGVS